MAKKFINKDGNTFVEVKPWYKKWWIWVIAVIVVIFVIGAFSGGSDDSSSASPKTHKATTSKTKNTNSSNTTSTKKLSLSDDSFTIDKEVDYNPNYNDNSWAQTKVNISKVRVIKIKAKNYYDGDKTYRVKGIIMVHFKVTPTRDIDFYPTQGTLVTNGQQVDADSGNSDDFDGEISKGATQTGNVVFVLKNMADVNSIKNIRLKWDADYDTDNYDDDNSSKTYDITMNLNN